MSQRHNIRQKPKSVGVADEASNLLLEAEEEINFQN